MKQKDKVKRKDTALDEVVDVAKLEYQGMKRAYTYLIKNMETLMKKPPKEFRKKGKSQFAWKKIIDSKVVPFLISERDKIMKNLGEK